MKLSASSLSILRNFASINPSILFREGKLQKSISLQEDLLVKADLEDEIDEEFCVYDLPRFMNTLSLFKDPEIRVEGSYAIVGSGKSKIKYTLAERKHIKEAPSNDIVMPNVEVSFSLTNEVLQNLFKAIGVLSLPDIGIVGDGKQLTLQSLDSANKIHDNYVHVLGETDKEFKVIIKAEKIKLLPMDYVVSVARQGSEGLTHFKGSAFNAEYWISIEESSTFG